MSCKTLLSMWFLKIVGIAAWCCGGEGETTLLTRIWEIFLMTNLEAVQCLMCHLHYIVSPLSLPVPDNPGSTDEGPAGQGDQCSRPYMVNLLHQIKIVELRIVWLELQEILITSTLWYTRMPINVNENIISTTRAALVIPLAELSTRVPNSWTMIPLLFLKHFII